MAFVSTVAMKSAKTGKYINPGKEVSKDILGCTDEQWAVHVKRGFAKSKPTARQAAKQQKQDFQLPPRPGSTPDSGDGGDGTDEGNGSEDTLADAITE